MKTFFTTARLTGLFYFGLAVTGVLAFLFAREKLYVPEDAVKTALNFATQEGLARFGIASELALVLFQALTAIWFFKLFRKTHLFAAVSIAVFGAINTILILITNAFWLSAVTLASGITTPSPEQATTIMTLFEMHEAIWVVGKLFFGLWLIPMGYGVFSLKMSQVLGWILIAGGIGYIVSAFLSILTPDMSPAIVENITVPATIGEFWIIGYLLFKKVKA